MLIVWSVGAGDYGWIINGPVVKNTLLLIDVFIFSRDLRIIYVGWPIISIDYEKGQTIFLFF